MSSICFLPIFHVIDTFARLFVVLFLISIDKAWITAAKVPLSLCTWANNTLRNLFKSIRKKFKIRTTWKSFKGVDERGTYCYQTANTNVNAVWWANNTTQSELSAACTACSLLFAGGHLIYSYFRLKFWF